MKKHQIILIILLGFIITSCESQYSKAKRLYDSQNYYLSKHELREINSSNENYDDAILLIIKIDSILYDQMIKKEEKLIQELIKKEEKLIQELEYITKEEKLNNSSSLSTGFMESLPKLRDIDSSNTFYIRKEILTMVNDSIIYHTSLKKYKETELNTAKYYLNYLSSNKKYKKKGERLIKRIEQKEKYLRKNQRYIAKATISKIMHIKPSKIRVELTDDPDYFHVSYYSRDERGRVYYKVRINGRDIVWGNYNGRWRNDKYDSELWYVETKNTYTIHEKWDDGSSNKRTYSKKGL